MKLESVEIENYRAIERLHLPLHPMLTVLHGGNTCGKTSVLSAVAVGLGVIPRLLGVSETSFLETDRHVGTRTVRIALAAIDGITWERRMVRGPNPAKLMTKHRHIGPLQKRLNDIARVDGKKHSSELPIVAFYDTDRCVLDMPKASVFDQSKRHRGYAKDSDYSSSDNYPEDDISYVDDGDYSPRVLALEGALAARTNFPELFRWFYSKEDEELREQRKRRSFDYRQPDLCAVRNAISSMLDGVTDPHIEMQPLRFSVSERLENGRVNTLEIDQLSDGQRAVLALTADLAWRMAQGNPHLDDPLTSEAIVLIDELELHLHPSWQQRILKDLRRTFPNAQFIVSTHSPQVLTTVEPEHIVELAREDGRVVAGSVSGWTYGAEAGDVLSVIMGVDERPVNEFTKKLALYRRLINEDKGESQEALALRRGLERRSPEDPALGRADIEIRRRKLFREKGKLP